jgi:toxin ParE1/3/4
VKPVIFDPDARAELDRALAASPDPGAFQAELDVALGDIASGLRQHPRVGRSRYRTCILPNLPYTVVYAETDDVVEVAVFAHHSRRPGYWKKRLRPN